MRIILCGAALFSDPFDKPLLEMISSACSEQRAMRGGCGFLRRSRCGGARLRRGQRQKMERGDVNVFKTGEKYARPKAENTSKS